VYAAHAPGTQLRTGRGVKRSPLHEKMIAQGAWFKDVSGWESPDWYAGLGQTPTAAPSWDRQAWFEHWRAEHEAVRTGVGLIDMSFMAKFLVEGPDAAAVLDRISAAAVAGQVGRITYTQWLNELGGIEADLTVTRLAEERFLVVASDAAHGHTLAWLGRHTVGADVRVSDVTAAYAQVNVQGPRSREVLQATSESDFSPEAFAFRDARWVDIGCAPVLAVRITYVGELGWELYVPVEHAGHVYDTLVEAGGPMGLRHVGLKALGSLRLEKAYRDYGHDIDNTDDLASVGLGFGVAKDKPVDWIGRGPTLAALAALAARPPSRRLVQVLLLDPEPQLHHAEILLRDGVPVGDVRSGSYGWTLGGAVGLAMVSGEGLPVTADWLAAGAWEVDIAGHRYAARVSLRPLYDPTSARVQS
ncbi:MAG: aminomethyltransferase family protein, partial [Candidatus Phosphoribacter sp.]